MSAPLYSGVSYLSVSTAALTLLKGDKGDPGDPGADGADGVSAFTTTTAAFVQPATSASVLVSVASSAWMAVNQIVYVAGGGYYSVASKPTVLSVSLTNLGYDGNALAGATVASGAAVNAGGVRGAAGADGGSAGAYFSNVDPNGVVTATRPALCYAANGTTWIKTNAGDNNTGWVKSVSAMLLYGTTAERDATSPAASGTLWVLTDSDPANQLSIWDGAAWN